MPPPAQHHEFQSVASAAIRRRLSSAVSTGNRPKLNVPAFASLTVSLVSIFVFTIHLILPITAHVGWYCRDRH